MPYSKQDVVFFDPSSRARVILEVSIVTIGSDTSLGGEAVATVQQGRGEVTLALQPHSEPPSATAHRGRHHVELSSSLALGILADD